jgi:hypothetical protein
VMGSCIGSPDVSVSNEADFDLLGFSTEPTGRIEADMGFVSPRVDRLSIHPTGGSAFQIPILKGPDGWDVRFFLTFFYEGWRVKSSPVPATGTRARAVLPMRHRRALGRLPRQPSADSPVALGT